MAVSSNGYHRGNRVLRTGAGRFIWWLFLGLLFWLPWPLGSNRAWAWGLAEVWTYALLALWMVAWASKKVRPGGAFRPARWMILVLGIWLVYGLFQFCPMPSSIVATLSPVAYDAYTAAGVEGWMTLSLDPHASAEYWFKSLMYVLLFALTLLQVDTRSRLQTLCMVLIAAGVAQALYGSFMTLSGMEYGFMRPKTNNLGLATGTFVNRNHFAGYLELTLAVGVGLLIAMMRNPEHGTTWRQRIRDWAKLILSRKMRLRIYLAVMVIALVLTHSRMGNAAFFSSMLITGLVALLLFKQAPRPMVILIISLVIIDITILGTWFGVERVVERLQETAQYDIESGEFKDRERLDVDDLVLGAREDFAWVGSGAGSFYSVFPSYRAPDVAGFYDHAHNDYLEILMEYGPAGFALLALFVIVSMATALAAMRQRNDPLMRGMAFAAVMGMTSYLIHSFVDFNLQIPANAATFMVVMALAWVAAHLGRRV